MGAYQRGSILIGLIVTMVITAALGAGMVYLTSTSTFQELFANNNARAYYAAESGVRYANARIREALATGDDTKYETMKAAVADKTYTMANGDTFKISAFSEDTATYPDSMRITYTSIGTVGSGFLQAKRKITYTIMPANQGSDPPGGWDPELTKSIPPEVTDFDNVTTPDLDEFFDPATPDDAQIKAIGATDGDPALNLVSPYYTTGLAWYTAANKLRFPQFDKIREYTDDLLSYKIQVKISHDVTPADKGFFMAGISFRLDDSATADYNYGNMYGIAFFNIDKTIAQNKWPDWFSEPASTVWSSPGIGIRKLGVDCGTTPTDPRCIWDGMENDNFYVVLFKRVGTTTSNGFYGKHTLLAYKKLSDMTGVLDGTALRKWSTLMVKVKEVKSGLGDPYGYTSVNARYNTIECFLQIPSEYPRRVGTTPEEKNAVSLVKWDNADFRAIDWVLVPSSGAVKGIDSNNNTISNMIVDASLNTLNYDGYTSSTTTKAREIGLHIYTRSEAANQIYYDNFYIDAAPSGPEGGDYVDPDPLYEGY
jgi:Tfp pilus assembly protein PilX